MTKPVKTYVALTALNIVNGARREAYGAPAQNFARIARYWNAYLENTGREGFITPLDVSRMSGFIKDARLDESPGHLDSYIDKVGYTLTSAEVADLTFPLDIPQPAAQEDADQ